MTKTLFSPLPMYRATKKTNDDTIMSTEGRRYCRAPPKHFLSQKYAVWITTCSLLSHHTISGSLIVTKIKMLCLAKYCCLFILLSQSYRVTSNIRDILITVILDIVTTIIHHSVTAIILDGVTTIILDGVTTIILDGVTIIILDVVKTTTIIRDTVYK